MKKRIFIAMHYMELGGAEMSLVGLLHALDYSRFDVDLMVYSHRGELMEMINIGVCFLIRIIDGNDTPTSESVARIARIRPDRASD